MKSSNKNVSNQKKETRLPVAINLQKRTIISQSHEEGSSSVETTTFPLPMDYCERSTKKTDEEEGYGPPPRKKLSLAKQTGQGKQFQSFELPKFLDEDEKTRAFDDDVDLAINQHEVVLPTFPTVPVPVLQSELQPNDLIYG